MSFISTKLTNRPSSYGSTLEPDSTDSPLHRARSISMAIEQQSVSNNSLLLSTSDFTKVVTRLRNLEEQWKHKRISHQPISISFKYQNKPLIDEKHNNPLNQKQFMERMCMNNENMILNINGSHVSTNKNTMQSLFIEIKQLKNQNKNMCSRMEQLRKVLQQSKTYAISLKKQNSKLISDIDFQTDLHQKQRRIWKEKIRSSEFNLRTKNTNIRPRSQNMDPPHKSSADNLDILLRDLYITIEKQREEIQLKNDQISQTSIKTAHKEKELKSHMNKEIQYLRSQSSIIHKEFTNKYSLLTITYNKTKEENIRLSKTLQYSQNELNANRKLIEVSRPKNGSQTEQQLFQLEQDYLNLSEVLISCQKRCSTYDDTISALHLELKEGRSMHDEQVIKIDELMEDNKLLNKLIVETESDNSDLVSVIQQEWMNAKEEMSMMKNKIRDMQDINDALLAKSLVGGNDEVTSGGHVDPESIVIINELEKQMQRLKNDNLSQEVLVKQFLEQQKLFQKRNRALAAKIKVLKKKNGKRKSSQNVPVLTSDFIGNGSGDREYDGLPVVVVKHKKRKSKNKHKIAVSMNNVFGGGQVPDVINIDFVTVYEHYIQNPLLSSNDMLKNIKINAGKVQGDGSVNDYVHIDVNDYIFNMHSSKAVMAVIEETLLSRQVSLNDVKRSREQILDLREKCQKEIENKERVYLRIQKECNRYMIQIEKYQTLIKKYEEKSIICVSTSQDSFMAQIERLHNENERLIEEFLLSANMWNSEKAIIYAEKEDIQNNLQFVSVNLDQLINDRQLYEFESEHFQQIYFQLMSHLKEQGIRVNINQNKSPVKSEIAYSTINNKRFSLSSPNKSPTIRMSTYQRRYEQLRQQQQYPPRINEEPELSSTSRGSFSLPIGNSSPISISTSVNNMSLSTDLPLNITYSSSTIAPALTLPYSSSSLKQSSTDYVSSLIKIGNKKKVKKYKIHRKSQSTSESETHPVMKKHESVFNRMMNLTNPYKDGAHIRPIDIMMSSSAPSSRKSSMDYKRNKSKSVGAVNVDWDESFDIVLFDEPDTFNFLDEEYKKIAIQVIQENEYYFSQNVINELDSTHFIQSQLNHEILEAESNLPILQAWMEKKSPTITRGWQKRWVVVVDYNLFYSKTECYIEDVHSVEERKKFLNFVPLAVVQYIVATDHSKTGRRFEIVARDTKTGDRRHYQWRAQTREQCTLWVDGLKKHKKVLDAKMTFITTNAR